MPIKLRAQKVIVDTEKKLGPSKEFRSLRDFYKKMQAEGAVMRHEYSLPLPETAGEKIVLANLNRQ